MGFEQVLAEAEFFSGLDEQALASIAASGGTRSLVRNESLFEEEDEPRSLFVVTFGRIAISNRSVDGRESVVALMEEGDLFGEMGLLDGLARSAGARALEPSEVIEIPYAPVRKAFESNPESLWGVVRLLSQRIRTMDGVLADAVFLDVTGRTAKRVLELSDGADTFVMPVTQEELAGMVGASRERVNKAIASFIRLGWIEQMDRRYTIIERAKLTQRSR
jgi:CRP/FNR family transcriptional regulator, cyclic AMP receptor protein